MVMMLSNHLRKAMPDRAAVASDNTARTMTSDLKNYII